MTLNATISVKNNKELIVMKKRKRIISFGSYVLALSLFLSMLFIPTVYAQTSIDDIVDSSLQVETVSKNDNISSSNLLYISTVDNGDGTHTLTLHEHPVKYYDNQGVLRDISLDIVSNGNGGFKTFSADAQTVFPHKISEGISLSGNNVHVKMTPSVFYKSYTDDLTMSINSLKEAETVFNETTVRQIDKQSVSYDYGEKTKLEYSLTYTGFKEDIVVYEYTGQTEYSFVLETGGLTLTEIDGSYYLCDGQGNISATLGDIIIFTADEKNNALGSMSHRAIIENQKYELIIHVDADYLTDSKTKYPIRIDPTIEISYENNGASAIQDVTINSATGSSGSSGSMYIGKRESAGISRILMKFPGLSMSFFPTPSNIAEAKVQIRDLLCETTPMGIEATVFAGNSWSESTANWSNVNPNDYTPLDSFATISYSNGNSLSPKHRYSIDITSAVRSWKTGFYQQSLGIMLKAISSVENGSSYIFKTFASYNRASNKPTLVVKYYSGNAALVGIPDDPSTHDHLTALNNTSVHLNDIGISNNVYHNNTNSSTVQGYLDNKSIFVSRSHGYKYTLPNASNEQVLYNTNLKLSNATSDTLCSDSLYSLDLSNLKLVVFVGCETGYGGSGARNLPSAAVSAGATTAIGFSSTINCADANRWTNAFFYFLKQGDTVKDACSKVKSTQSGWNNASIVNSVVICGDENNRLYY